MSKLTNHNSSVFVSRLFYNFVRITGALPGLVWLRPRILYESPAARKRVRGGALIVSNHISFLDPVYLMFAVWYRRLRFICIKEFYNGRFSSLIFRLGRCIPIDRENVSMDTLREIVSGLKDGDLITIFPEGHINDSGEVMERFKSGAVLMSTMGARPILPIYIDKPKRPLSRLTAVIGEPMDPVSEIGRRPTSEQLQAFSERLREKELELMQLAEERKTK